MTKHNTFFLVVGKSGAGKSALCRWLSAHDELKQLQSYTTRAPRYEGEDGHIFVKGIPPYQRKELVAYTKFAGNEYWATAKDVEDSDLYVIDPSGVDYFMKAYRGPKLVRVIYLESPFFTRFWRMISRGDGVFVAIKRLFNDVVQFRGFKKRADLVVKNTDLVAAGTKMEEFIVQESAKNHVGFAVETKEDKCPFENTSRCIHCENGNMDDGTIYCGRDKHRN